MPLCHGGTVLSRLLDLAAPIFPDLWSLTLRPQRLLSLLQLSADPSPRPLLGACTDLDLSSFQISSTLAILVLDGLRADHQKSAKDTLPRSIQPSSV